MTYRDCRAHHLLYETSRRHQSASSRRGSRDLSARAEAYFEGPGGRGRDVRGRSDHRHLHARVHVQLSSTAGGRVFIQRTAVHYPHDNIGRRTNRPLAATYARFDMRASLRIGWSSGEEMRRKTRTRGAR